MYQLPKQSTLTFQVHRKRSILGRPSVTLADQYPFLFSANRLHVCRRVRRCNFQVGHPRCVGRITSIGKMQSNTTFNICIAKRCFYIGCLNNYMFRPLYRPSLGCTLSYYKANCTIYNVSVFVHDISCTSIKFAFKIITVAVEFKKLF
jgi:hypothetical protein